MSWKVFCIFACVNDTQTKKEIMIHDYVKTENGYEYGYPRAAMTADVVIFGFDGQGLRVLLVKRGEEPYLGQWALPGGFLRMEETIEECARRELREETGLSVMNLQQLGVFSAVDRDPRYRVVTVAFYALANVAAVRGMDDAMDAAWFALEDIVAERYDERGRKKIEVLMDLAFDHKDILKAALVRLRQDLHFHPVGFDLLPEKFSIPQLQRLYEAILSVSFDRRNFHKKILTTGILIDLGEKDAYAKHRAGSLYRFDEEQYVRMKSDGTLRFEF